jgi:hypothetical protein
MGRKFGASILEIFLCPFADREAIVWYHTGMKRTTIADLVLSVRHLNSAMGFSDDAGAAIGVNSVPGSYYLQGAYGGWQLQRVHPSGGCESVTSGYRSKRELWELVNAIRYGVLEGTVRMTGLTI